MQFTKSDAASLAGSLTDVFAEDFVKIHSSAPCAEITRSGAIISNGIIIVGRMIHGMKG